MVLCVVNVPVADRLVPSEVNPLMPAREPALLYCNSVLEPPAAAVGVYHSKTATLPAGTPLILNDCWFVPISFGKSIVYVWAIVSGTDNAT